MVMDCNSMKLDLFMDGCIKMEEWVETWCILFIECLLLAKVKG